LISESKSQVVFWLITIIFYLIINTRYNTWYKSSGIISNFGHVLLRIYHKIKIIERVKKIHWIILKVFIFHFLVLHLINVGYYSAYPIIFNADPTNYSTLCETIYIYKHRAHTKTVHISLGHKRSSSVTRCAYVSS